VKLSLSFGLALSALLVAGALPASAYTIVSIDGNHGDYTFSDTTDSPPVTCMFGQPQPPFETAYLHKVKVRAPALFAIDRTGARDHQKVSWQFKVQGQVFDSGPDWTTFVTSPLKTGTAYDNTPAPFNPITVKFNSRTQNPDPERDNFVYRMMVIMRWYKPSGAVGGTIKLMPTYYRVKGPFSPPFTNGGEYCGAINTAG
jgi:hypothetical protein